MSVKDLAMRLSLALPVAAILGGGPAARAEQVRVSKVVVYPDRAQVTRVVSVPCGPGVMARFGGIPPAADPGSLRAQTSVGRVDGLRSEERVRDEAFAKRAAALESDIRQQEGALRALRDRQAQSESAARVAAQYGEVAVSLIGREMSEPPNLHAFTGALDSVLSARLKAVAALAELQPLQRALELRLSELRRERALALGAAGRREYLAEAIVTCPEGPSAQVELSYLVGGASWAPAHEARVRDDGSVEVSSYATVTQETGEDWSSARLVLSTAVPRQNATPPAIAALKVYGDQRPPPKKIVVSREETVSHADAPSRNEPPAQGAGRVRVAAQGLSVQFVVPEPADVSGDGTPVRLLLARTGLRAQLKYSTVPKLLPYVFRVADLTNTAGYPLLAGPIDIFRRGQFIGRYGLARVAAGERFQLSLGLEDGLKVKRIVVEEVARDRGLLGGTRRHRYAYRFEVANYQQQAQDLELSEHVPVSELDEVQVGLDGKTTPGYDLRQQDGILTWRLRLRPGERRAVDLLYHVDVPASYGTGD